MSEDKLDEDLKMEELEDECRKDDEVPPNEAEGKVVVLYGAESTLVT